MDGNDNDGHLCLDDRREAHASPFLAFLVTSSFLVAIVYRLLFSPLRHVPGPALWKVSRFPFAYQLVRGQLPYAISALHERYGPVVRVAPNEISFITEEAWIDIYTGYKSNLRVKAQMKLDPLFRRTSRKAGKDILFEVDDDEHARQRRVLSHAFSEKSLRDQEPVIKYHIDQLVAQILAMNNESVDMSARLNYTFFDTIGDLLLGESFDCIETGSLHSTVRNLISAAKGVTLYGMAQRFWPLTYVLLMFVPRHLREAKTKHRDFTKARIQRRLQYSKSNADMISKISEFIDAPGSNTISRSELCYTASLIIVAGSEPSATTLSFLFYHLLRDPQRLALLTREICSTVRKSVDVALQSVRGIPYLLAAINEALRLFAQLPSSSRRITPRGGCMISRIYVPGNTTVAVNTYAAEHSSSKFHEPEESIPERWLSAEDLKCDAAQFTRDMKGAVRPFSMGSPTSIGKRLAMAEMSLLVARLLWKFDIDLQSESERWLDGIEVYTFYERPPLMCRLRSTNRYKRSFWA